MDPALDYQSHPQSLTIMRILIASRAPQVPGLGVVTQPTQQLPLTLVSALRVEPEGTGLDNGMSSQFRMTQNQAGCSNPS